MNDYIVSCGAKLHCIVFRPANLNSIYTMLFEIERNHKENLRVSKLQSCGGVIANNSGGCSSVVERPLCI